MARIEEEGKREHKRLWGEGEKYGRRKKEKVTSYIPDIPIPRSVKQLVSMYHIHTISKGFSLLN